MLFDESRRACTYEVVRKFLWLGALERSIWGVETKNAEEK